MWTGVAKVAIQCSSNRPAFANENVCDKEQQLWFYDELTYSNLAVGDKISWAWMDDGDYEFVKELRVNEAYAKVFNYVLIGTGAYDIDTKLRANGL